MTLRTRLKASIPATQRMALRMLGAYLQRRLHFVGPFQAARILADNSHENNVDRDSKLISQALTRVEDRDGLTLWEGPGFGRFWAPSSNAVLSTAWVLAEAKHSPYTREGHTVRPGDVVIDCGCNIGVFSRFALDNGASRVVALEPAPDNARCLKLTFQEAIADGRFILVEVGAWNRSDVLTFNVNSATSGRNSFVSRDSPESRTLTIQVAPIDAILEKCGIQTVHFIKIDVEGAETQALAGAGKTIQRSRPLLSVATEHFPQNAEQVVTTLASIAPYRAQVGKSLSQLDGHIFPETIFLSPIR